MPHDHIAGFGVHGDATPGLQNWGRDDFVAWVMSIGLVAGDAPSIADHRPLVANLWVNAFHARLAVAA